MLPTGDWRAEVHPDGGEDSGLPVDVRRQLLLLLPEPQVCLRCLTHRSRHRQAQVQRDERPRGQIPLVLPNSGGQFDLGLPPMGTLDQTAEIGTWLKEIGLAFLRADST